MGLVIYIDMDYFFAACEEKRHPELRGKPLAVGTSDSADKLRGVVQTCNYEARKYGIRSGMPTLKAFQLYKDLQYVKADDAYYEEVSNAIMEYLSSLGYPVEKMSIDEAAIDVGDLGYRKANELAERIKGEIRQRLDLPCTIGISIGKVFAKMACDKAKPDGLLTIDEAHLHEFLKSTDVKKLPGVGSKSYEKLSAMGVKSIADIRNMDPLRLVDEFGSFGRELYALAGGIDESKVVSEERVLSISRERTLRGLEDQQKEIDDMLKVLSKEVIAELDKREMEFGGVGVKVRYVDFSEKVRDRALSYYSNSYEVLYSNAVSMIRELSKANKVRKIGVKAYRLGNMSGQKKLF